MPLGQTIERDHVGMVKGKGTIMWMAKANPGAALMLLLCGPTGGDSLAGQAPAPDQVALKAPTPLKHHARVYGAAVSPDGRTVATLDERDSLTFWDVYSRQKLRELSGGKRRHGPARGFATGEIPLAFSPDGKTLAVATSSGTVVLWEVVKGEVIANLKGRAAGELTSVAFSPDGKQIASGPHEEVVCLWDVATRQVVRTFPVEENAFFGIGGLAFSADGKALAFSWKGETLPLWDVHTGKKLQQLKGHRHWMSGIAFSPDGKTLATADLPGKLRFWDPVKGSLLRTVTQPRCFTPCVAFAPNGKVVVTGNGKGNVRYDEANNNLFADETKGNLQLWDVATGRQLLELDKLNGQMMVSAVFARGGRALVTIDSDGGVLLWDLHPVSALRPAAVALGPKELDRLWSDLAGGDVVAANRSAWALVAVPKQTIPFLQKRLRPAAAHPEKPALEQMLVELTSGSVAERAKAAASLEVFGRSALPALRTQLRGTLSAEAAKRVRALIDLLEKQNASSEELLAARVVQVLEDLETPASRQLLDALSKGAPDVWLTEQAREALQRLTAGKP